LDTILPLKLLNSTQSLHYGTNKNLLSN